MSLENNKYFFVGKIGEFYEEKSEIENKFICCDNLKFSEKKDYSTNCGMPWFWEY